MCDHQLPLEPMTAGVYAPAACAVRFREIHAMVTETDGDEPKQRLDHPKKCVYSAGRLGHASDDVARELSHLGYSK